MFIVPLTSKTSLKIFHFSSVTRQEQNIKIDLIFDTGYINSSIDSHVLSMICLFYFNRNAQNDENGTSTWI